MNKKAYGFTIVELLIVIVVIAVLAAIGSIAYSGIQQRARNAAIINTASSTVKLIQAYIAQEGAYPLAVNGMRCITAESGCQSTVGDEIGASPDLHTELAKVGTVSQSVPVIDSHANGILYVYGSSIIIDGASQPLHLIYWLQGTNQSCGLGNLIAATSPYAHVTTPYSLGDNAGKTRCNVLIPGPGHS